MKITIPRTITLSTLTLWLIFVINPFVDALTGLMVYRGWVSEGGIGSPSQLFRLVLSLIMLVQIRDMKSGRIIIFTLLYLVLVELFAFSMHNNTGALVSGLVYAYKLVFALLVCFTLYKYIVEKRLDIYQLIDWIILSGIICCSLVFLSDRAGLSNASYGGTDVEGNDASTGSKGPFASGNGLGFYIGVVSMLLMYRFGRLRKRIDLAYLVLVGYVLLGLKSKTSLGLFAITLVIGFFLLPRKAKWAALGIGGFVLLFFLPVVVDVFSAVGDILIWKFNTAMETGNVMEFFTGGRSNYIAAAFDQWDTSGILFLRVFTGMGYFYASKTPFEWLDQYKLMENDVFDIFFMFGIVAVIFYLYIFIDGYRCIRKIGAKIERRIMYITWSACLLHSAVAGHVFFNGMSVVMLMALYAALKFYNTYEKPNSPVDQQTQGQGVSD